MPPFAVWVAVAIGGNVLYHVAQKSIPSGAPPLLSLLVTYAVAFVATALLLPLAPEKLKLRDGLSSLNWASIGVGVSIVAVELGVLLAYRAGWRMSVASLTVSSALALVLVPVGVTVYRERLSPANVAGLVLCLAGLVLVARK
jgi:drug/metabolite transporter (DMT)-like permease